MNISIVIASLGLTIYMYFTIYTVLSQASTHGCSQLKHQNLMVGGYTEKVLKWFNYPRARAHPRCEVSCHGTELTCIIGLFLLHQGQPNRGEGYIVLQSGPTRSFIAKFSHVQSSPAVCEFRATGKNAANKAMERCVRTWCHGTQSASEQSELCELSGPTFGFTTQELSMVGGYTENPEIQYQEFITGRVCNSHIWIGWRTCRQSAVNMLSCENTAAKRWAFAA